MIACCNTGIVKYIGEVIFWAMFNTSFINRLGECTIRTIQNASPCCVICEICVWTLVLTSFCYIISELFTRASCHACHWDSVSKCTIQSHWTFSHTFSGHCLSKIINWTNFLTHSYALSDSCNSWMFKCEITLRTNCNTSPCSIISE